MEVWLFDRWTRRLAAAQLLPMTDLHVARFNATWVPEFNRRHERRDRDQDFLMWKHGVSMLDLQARGNRVRGHVVMIAGDVQGVLALDEVAEPSRLMDEAWVLLVRYLATAPWNRPGRLGPGRYRGVGTVLLAQAVLSSMEAGCAGRLGLHALSDSNGFYRSIGFEDLGPDPAERGLRYFELAATQATCLTSSVLPSDSGRLGTAPAPPT